MSERDLLFLNEGLDFTREAKEPQGVCNGCSIAADASSDFFLGQSQSFYKLLISLCFLDRIEVLAMNVLNEREFEHVLIRDVTDDRRDLQQSSHLGCSPSAFSGNQLVAKAATSNDNRLYETMSSDGVRELTQPLFIISSTGLMGIRIDKIDVQLSDLLCRCGRLTKKRFKTSAERLSRHD